MEPHALKSGGQKEEDSVSENLRMGAALAFVFVLLAIGVPLWWKMTEVKRHPLPNARIIALNDIDPTVIINVFVHSPNSVTSQKIINSLNQLFNESDLFQATVKEVSINMKNLKSLDVNSLENLKEIQDLTTQMNSFLLFETASFWDTEQLIALGAHRTIYFYPSTPVQRICAVFSEILLQEAEMQDSMKAMVEPGFMSKSAISQRRVRTSTNYDIIFSIVSPQPKSVSLDWDVRKMLKQYIKPLLSQLSALANFHLKSQWLHFIDLEQISKKSSGATTDSHSLPSKQLPHLISPLEKKLGISSGVAKYPCIHFVLYATPCKSHPLYFQSKDGSLGTVMLSARWGGIQLLHANTTMMCNSTEPFVPDDKQVMSHAQSLLRTLLGLQDFSKDVYILNVMDVHLNLWELDYLVRLRSLEQFAAARLTLSSLARLLNRISNIVITEEVSQAVSNSVDAAEKVLNAFSAGNASEALKFSKIAFNQAEYAFTHPSLLALLYFPDDQKYAVYIPLFLPIMIPVILSMKSIRPWLMLKLSKLTKNEKSAS